MLRAAVFVALICACVHESPPQQMKARKAPEVRRKQARNEYCEDQAKDDREYADCVGQQYEDLRENRR